MSVKKQTSLKHGNLCIFVNKFEECFQEQKSEISKNNLLMWKNIAAKKKDTIYSILLLVSINNYHVSIISILVKLSALDMENIP